MQSVDAEPFKGRRIRLAGELRTEDAGTGATIWFRVDAAKGTLLFDNLELRRPDGPLIGTQDWSERSVVFDIAEEALSLHYGFLRALAGAGLANSASTKLTTPSDQQPQGPGPPWPNQPQLWADDRKLISDEAGGSTALLRLSPHRRKDRRLSTPFRSLDALPHVSDNGHGSRVDGLTMSRGVSGLNHITLAVADVERSLAFYRDVLGCAVRAVWSGGAYLEAGSLWLCLSRDQHVRSSPHPDYTHIAFSVSEEFYGELSALVAANSTTWKDNRSEGASTYFLDPDGHKLELHVGTLQTRLAHYLENPGKGVTVFGSQSAKGH